MPSPKKNQPKNQTPDFEKSLAELEKIVRRMERGEQTLEQTLKDYERGMALSEVCRNSLDAARQRVEKLVVAHDAFDGDADGYALEPLEDERGGE